MNRNQKVMFMLLVIFITYFLYIVYKYWIAENTGLQISNGFHSRVSVCNKEK